VKEIGGSLENQCIEALWRTNCYILRQNGQIFSPNIFSPNIFVFAVLHFFLR
jgi:hypothetical protein